MAKYMNWFNDYHGFRKLLQRVISDIDTEPFFATKEIEINPQGKKKVCSFITL